MSVQATHSGHLARFRPAERCRCFAGLLWRCRAPILVCRMENRFEASLSLVEKTVRETQNYSGRRNGALRDLSRTRRCVLGQHGLAGSGRKNTVDTGPAFAHGSDPRHVKQRRQPESDRYMPPRFAFWCDSLRVSYRRPRHVCFTICPNQTIAHLVRVDA